MSGRSFTLLDAALPADITASRSLNPTVTQLRSWRHRGLRLTGDDEGALIMAEIYDVVEGRLVYCGGMEPLPAPWLEKKTTSTSTSTTEETTR